MLPIHLQNIDSSSDRRNNSQRPYNSLSAPPPLGLTGVLCDSHTLTLPHGSLQYTVFRPRHLHHRPPLICVAGGPLLPSTYLSPLVHLVTDRSIVLYDAVGCGQSKSNSVRSQQQQTQEQQVAQMVDELTEVIKAIECDEFHLYGHSFGGVLVYEYLRQVASASSPPTKVCRGAILASVPFSLADCESHCQNLLNEIRHELGSDAEAKDVSQAFCERYECRIQPLPFPLQQAFQLAGFTSSNAAAGLKAVSSYQLVSIDSCITSAQSLPPVLILRGQFDFVTPESCDGWARTFSKSQCITLAGSSHYGMLEQETMYGSVLTFFLQENDPPMKPLFPQKHLYATK